MVQKSLDVKVARILADPSCRDFILADAKDADMAAGMAAPGRSPEHHAHEGRFRSLAEYRELIRRNVKQGLVDIMLMSASTSEVLTIRERLFDASHVTPAARANDTTDIWMAMGGAYGQEASRPFRTATIDHIMCGKAACAPAERAPGGLSGADLGLYSITFNNDLERDRETLKAYREFRLEAEAKGFRHFLEVFDPNAPREGRGPADLGRFINDQIARTLAGVVGKGRPLFLKIPYHGPAALEQLVAYDRSLIVGILGGSSGTTYDAFLQLRDARRYGAKAALYGRMINNSENQQLFIQHLRWLADGDLDDPVEAVKSYHGALQKLGIKPYRALEDDRKATLRQTAYGPTAERAVVDGGKRTAPAAAPQPVPKGEPAAAPDFARMTPAERVAWNKARWDRILG